MTLVESILDHPDFRTKVCTWQPAYASLPGFLSTLVHAPELDWPQVENLPSVLSIVPATRFSGAKQLISCREAENRDVARPPIGVLGVR